MDDNFVLSIHFKDRQRDFLCRLVRFGYSYRIAIWVESTEVFFEPDEEGGFRAVMIPGQATREMEKIDRQLLGLLAEKIQELLKS